MYVYRVSCLQARKRGAIGVFHVVVETIAAESLEAATARFREDYECNAEVVGAKLQ